MHLRLSRTLLIFIILGAAPIVAAYLQWAVFGLPNLADGYLVTPAVVSAQQGFPSWLRLTHYINFLMMLLLIRSGLQILMDHPRLYWNVHCTPGTEWLKLTPIEVPRDRVWSAKDDARYLTPWIGLPGGRHTVGIARHWHFLSVLFWICNGLVYVTLVMTTRRWERFIPESWGAVVNAWAFFVHYATFHLPPEPNGFYAYNTLQQLSYFGVVFVLAPLALLTGLSMSPALTARFKWYPRLPGNRQVGRSMHFLIMCAFVAFIVIHVTMVSLTGFTRNMNHIVLGTDDLGRDGIYLGLFGLALILLLNGLANLAAWRRPRLVQHIAAMLVTPLMRRLLNKAAPVAEFRPEDISPYFWVNGKVPTSAEWTTQYAESFRSYRLTVGGLVENPVTLSLADLQTLGKKTQITLHHCIQGWSGIAQWGGLPLADLIALVKPKPEAKAVVFFSFGEGGEGGQFYDSLPMATALHPQTILAYEMNGKPLGRQHGAPLRLRVENQLGFKMVKWIKAIEFVANTRSVGDGEGGYNEDREYFGELANI